MHDRRKFVKLSLLSSAALLAGKRLLARPACAAPNNEALKGSPIVISTWDFGREANAAAWDILGKGGRALDAVETGVKVPEADPNTNLWG